MNKNFLTGMLCGASCVGLIAAAIIVFILSVHTHMLRNERSHNRHLNELLEMTIQINQSEEKVFEPNWENVPEYTPSPWVDPDSIPHDNTDLPMAKQT